MGAFFLLALVAVTLTAYQPAWHGGLLWDDDGHLTRADLRPLGGLWRIWFEPGATQQYYPVLHSAFWLMQRLFGDHTLGYHLVNIVVHAASAFLLWMLLRRLAVPGAFLASLAFALHPVHVESVAWITELKNVLSGAFYLAAAVAYVRFDETREPRMYATALLLFVLAVFSKSVTATLPVALLILFWWRRGRVRFADVKPLVPFVAIGIAAGLTTIWVERTFIGARGSEFDLSFAERTLLAARASWFYAGKLLWPADLIFIYPRWEISTEAMGQWLLLLALVAVLVASWVVRDRSRVPLATVLLFLTALFPALGFFDVYPFRFSYVADHFQYLASIAVLVPLAALLVRFAPERALAAAACGVLGLLTWRQAHMYQDAETLYRETIRRNPTAWIAHNNLAAILLAGEPDQRNIEEATATLHTALALRPDYPEAHYNLGTALERLGRRDEAAAAYRRVLEIDPGQPRALQRLAVLRHDQASALVEEGLAHEAAGRMADAEHAYREAARLDGSRELIPRALGRVLHRVGRHDEAIEAYSRALAIEPRSFEAHNDLGVLLAQRGDLVVAARHFEAAASIRPDAEGARANLARVRQLLSGLQRR